MMVFEHTCFYPGKFSPPTKFHLNTLFWLLTRPEVGHVNIVIGKDEPGELPQEQKVKIWELLLKSSMAPKASIIKSNETGPLGEIYEIFSKKPDMPGHIALDEKSARNKKLQKRLSKFPNYSFQLTPSKFDNSSAAMMKAVTNDDKAAVKELLPDDFSDSMVEAYMDILKVQPDMEAPEDKSTLINYQQQYNEMFNDGFWNSVFQPIVEDISSSDALTTIDSLQTVADGKRDIAFILIKGASGIDAKDIPLFIKDNGLKSMYVKGNPSHAYVVYRPGSEHGATELKDIAEKYGGYLKYDAAEQDSRRIGELLGYQKSDIDAYIDKVKKDVKNNPIDEIVKLNEIADSPYTFSSPKEEKPGNFYNDIDYTFTTDGGREYYIRFGSRWVGRSKKNDQKYNWATELTFFPTKLSHVGDPGEVGGENFGKILATVTKALKEFVQKYKPEYVFWKGIKTDKESEKGNTVDVTKRQRIYNAVMDRTVSGMSNYKSTKGNARSSIEYEKEIPVQGSDDIFKYPEEPSIDNPTDNAKKLARFNLSR